MLIDLVLGFGVLVGILTILAEGTKKPEVGVMAALLLLMLGLWVLTDGMQYKTGETVTTSITGTNPTTSTETVDGNVTTIYLNTTMNQTESATTAYVYANIPETPYFSMVTLLGLVMILLSMYGLLHYAMEIFNY